MRIEKVEVYICETCGRRFSTVDECAACERSHSVVKRVELHFHTSTGSFSMTQETAAKAAPEVVKAGRVHNPCDIYWYIECDGTTESMADAAAKLRDAAADWLYSKSHEVKTLWQIHETSE